MSSVVLPEGWCDTKLGAAIDYGKAVKKELSQVNSDMWILELEDIEKDSSKLIQRVLVADIPIQPEGTGKNYHNRLNLMKF